MQIQLRQQLDGSTITWVVLFPTVQRGKLRLERESAQLRHRARRRGRWQGPAFLTLGCQSCTSAKGAAFFLLVKSMLSGRHCLKVKNSPHCGDEETPGKPEERDVVRAFPRAHTVVVRTAPHES